jgi:hypothetical protein
MEALWKPLVSRGWRPQELHLEVSLASWRTYLVGQTRSLFREGRHPFGVGVDE